MKSILACQTGLPADHAVLRSAGVLAKMFDSHVDALHVFTGPQAIASMIGAGTTACAPPVAEMARELEEEAQERRKHARATFEEMVVRVGLPVWPAPRSGHAGPSIARIEIDSAIPVELVNRARTYDISVMAREARLLPDRLFAVIQGSGRPVLLVGSSPRETIGQNIAVLWKPGVEAARALAMAAPFLSPHCKLTLIVGTGTNDPDAAPSARGLQENLAWRGIQSQILTVEAVDHEGLALRDAVYSQECDLVVMGAYGRSRIRETVFGGVTRTFLESCDIPVLMAH